MYDVSYNNFAFLKIISINNKYKKFAKLNLRLLDILK